MKKIELYSIGAGLGLKILYPNGKVEYYNEYKQCWIKSVHSRRTFIEAKHSLKLYCEYIGSL